ncbi:MAG TPA: metal ABC transporter permease [Burkholderiaceae bacterium]|nr:metal ABC transporter permease [Burkholderiaceae bacterium]
MSGYAVLVQPFVDFAFMRRALVAIVALAVGSAPIGCLLVLRRMSLLGDAISHALLPGAALGYLVAGFSLVAMSGGGFVAALVVALLSAAVTRTTTQREDASFAAFYLIALALGVLLISTRGSSVDLVRVLFGSILAVDDPALLMIATVASATLLALAWMYRPLVLECFDPAYLRAVGGGGPAVHVALLVLTVANLVAGFQALGTLMSVGLMILPAVAARFWASEVWSLGVAAGLIALLAGVGGLLLSYHRELPAGPSIVLVAGAIYVASIVAGRRGGLLARASRRRRWRGA